MADMNIQFLLDRDLYKDLAKDALDGAAKLYGTAKKKLPRVLKPAKTAGEKTLDFLEDHKKELLVAGGVAVAVGAAGAVIALCKRRGAKKLEKTFDSYLLAMKNGTLTPAFLAGFIADLEKKELSVTEAQFDTVYSFTVKLASANGYEGDLAKESLDLASCLAIQKTVLETLSE